MTRLAEALAALEASGTASTRDGMARYGIVAGKTFGVMVGDIRRIAKGLGRDHALADQLWRSGWYEARLLAAFVDDPRAVTPDQMDRWAAECENWADCDTICFHLFDKTPHAFASVDRWAADEREFVRRAAFALLASLALHDKKCPDEPFLERLPLIESAAIDPRNFVKKGVSWALRGVGGRKSPALRSAAREQAERLAASSDKAARWIGNDAQKAFAKADKG
ncbi:MAG TPA: DNA alkylation repair protein [Allosphingosinicella sp.]|nr:DNA alkylation repair protein [Allosphingosinicella sp.]